MSGLEIPGQIFEQMVVQAKAAATVEACGILAGKDSKVEKLYEMTNVDNSSDHFTMEPKEQFMVAKNIRNAELEMLAIYHSHPASPARPSDEDIRLAIMPEIIHVILSLEQRDGPEVKAFKIEDGVVTAIPVKIVKV